MPEAKLPINGKNLIPVKAEVLELFPHPCIFLCVDNTETPPVKLTAFDFVVDVGFVISMVKNKLPVEDVLTGLTLI